MVQDPNFWRRFSVAVHNDEAAMLAAPGTGKNESKHAYVVSLSPVELAPGSPSSVPPTPTSTSHLSPAFPAQAFTRPASVPVFASAKEEGRECSKSVHYTTEEKGVEMVALHDLSQPSPSPSLPSTPKSTHFALPPTPKRTAKRTSRLRALTSHPPTPKSTHFPTPPFASFKNPSRISLGASLSGRPKSAFRFWTTISADACPYGNTDTKTKTGRRGKRSDSNRHGTRHGDRKLANAHNDSTSWLEGQNRKARQRGYMCWTFWGVFLSLVVGAVVAVLVLKRKGII